MGYFLEPSCLFQNVVIKAQNNDFILEDLERALKRISSSSTGHESENDFENLFEDVDLQSSKLGRSVEDKNKLISKILLHLTDIDFRIDDEEKDILGDAYEYLISQFASSAGKKAGEFYTPQEVSKILAKIVTLDKNKLKSVYDPTCGSGSLLLRVARETEVSDFFGQELNQTTYNLARMNMILHDVPFTDFDIRQGDSLENPQHMDKRFEAIVANPPFSAKWSSDSHFLDDERFSAYGKLAPKSKADFAFLQHMIYHLDENGTMGIVLPHGVLFRGAAEGIIRKYLINEKNYLDAVIGLPANIFYGTSIPTVVLIFKKCRTDDADILFIDASKEFEKVKNQNKLRKEDIDKIVNTYKNREEIEKYSEILKNKKEVVIASKMDLADGSKNLEEFKKNYPNVEVIPISAFNMEGIDEMIERLLEILKETPKEELYPQESFKVYKYEDNVPYKIKKDGNIWVVSGKEIETLLLMTKFNEDEGVLRFARKFKGMGIEDELEKMGAKVGDEVQILDYMFTFKG